MMYFSFIVLLLILFGIAYSLKTKSKLTKKREKLLNKPFPLVWKNILEKHVPFYRDLDDAIDKTQFEKQVQRFIATKKISALKTNLDDLTKLLVASSAVIPTFAFPEFIYPNVKEVLLYPNTFDHMFGTNLSEGDKHISGMVGTGIMSGKVILSKPDLLRAFDGQKHTYNIGIHEFVHLLDATDGEIDGIPENLLDKTYIAPWLSEMKKEMHQIKKGDSDINSYGLTNNAEFLAVVSEYFFSNPDKFKKRHFELYQYLEKIFNQKPA